MHDAGEPVVQVRGVPVKLLVVAGKDLVVVVVGSLVQSCFATRSTVLPRRETQYTTLLLPSGGRVRVPLQA